MIVSFRVAGRTLPVEASTKGEHHVATTCARRAIEDILNCRTAALGGQVWHCEQCIAEMFSWDSCANRSCPQCHTAQTKEWLERRRAEMLPVPHVHVTVPAELREVRRAHQPDRYPVLMQASAGAIIEIARDPRYVGGTMAVLVGSRTGTPCEQSATGAWK
jgi:hypothetical protein